MAQIQAQQSEGLSEHYEQRVMERTCRKGGSKVWKKLMFGGT